MFPNIQLVRNVHAQFIMVESIFFCFVFENEKKKKKNEKKNEPRPNR